MLHGELSKLVNRLRTITGQRVINVQNIATVTTIDKANLEVLQQCLRRHPCIDNFSHTFDEASGILFEQIKTTFDSPDASEGVGDTLKWINSVAFELEIERLSSVFGAPQSVIQSCEGKILEKLGFEQKPNYDQNSLAYACPWNVWLSLLGSPLVRHNPSMGERASLTINNSTPNTRRSCLILQSDIFDTDAWCSLLHDMEEFPLAAVRSIWLAATYFFPSCGALVARYLRKEISAAEELTPLAACLSDDDARKTFTCYLRVLNTFYRHLPLCYDCQLYEVFFDFIEKYIEPDRDCLIELYRITLQRDIGEHLNSTNIWNRYIATKLPSFSDQQLRREWQKKILFRMLQTPLRDLDKTKETFDRLFIESRNRMAPEEKTESEKFYNRSKAAAQELMKLAIMRPWCDSSSLFLPRPIRLDEVQDTNQNEIEIWASWHNMLHQHIKRPISSSASSRDSERFLRFLFMRASFFPFQVDSWTDIACCCLSDTMQLESSRRKKLIQKVVKLSSLFLFDELAIQLFHVNVVSSLNENETVATLFRDALFFHRGELLHYIQYGCADPTAAISHLQAITVLCVSWMKLPLKHRNRCHARLVARFTLHHVDFLSLCMGLMRTLMKSDSTVEPHRLLQPFHTFCSKWIETELISNRATDEAVLILSQWKGYIARVTKILSKRDWSAASCGADEMFVHSCVSVAYAAPEKLEEVLTILSDLKNSLQSTETDDGLFSALYEKALYDFFSPKSLTETAGCSFSEAPRTRLQCRYSAPQRLNSAVFQGTAHLYEVAPGAHQKTLSNSLPCRSESEMTFPEETLWNHSDSSTSSAPRPMRIDRKTPRHRDDEAIAEKAIRVEPPPFNAVVNVSTSFLPLSGLLGLDNDSLPLDKLELLIRKLPCEYQYNPWLGSEERVSLNWVMSVLSKCDGL